MNPNKHELLHDFLLGIPASKRQLNPDIFHPMDYKRLIKIVKFLIEHSEGIDSFNITSECKNIGEEYSVLLTHSDFEEQFCNPILSEINNAKGAIETYLTLKLSL